MGLLSKTCNYDRMNVQRLIARGFVVLGGVIWVSAALGAASPTYLNATPLETASMAVVPFVMAVAALAVGWFFERIAAYGLFAGAAGVVVWGVLAAWELGVWLTMAAVLIAPMVVAGMLFLLAAQTQAICASEFGTGAAHHA